MSRDARAAFEELRTEAIRRLAAGMQLPADILTPTPRRPPGPIRRAIAWRLHSWADRIDPHNAVRITGMTITLEKDTGWTLHGYDDPMRGRGFKVCYPGLDEYSRAHSEAANPS